MTTISADLMLRDVQDRLAQIREDINEIVARRQRLMLTARAELTAAGLEAEIVTEMWADAPRFSVGEIVRLSDTHHHSQNRPYLRETRAFPDHVRQSLGPWVGVVTEGWAEVHVGRGSWEVLIIDGNDMLLVKTGNDDEEAGHRKSLARLRNLARSSELRVTARDREVKLIDPMGNVVHAGDVVSAFLWVCGIDPAMDLLTTEELVERFHGLTVGDVLTRIPHTDDYRWRPADVEAFLVSADA